MTFQRLVLAIVLANMITNVFVYGLTVALARTKEA